VKDPDAVARKIVEEGLTVRDIEHLAQRQASESGAKPRKPREEKDADTRAMEKLLSDNLGLSVSIRHEGERGELKIRYETLEQLDSLCRRLTE
jgi:ParB family transcriptional regulator, chromosome partitioning protein